MAIVGLACLCRPWSKRKTNKQTTCTGCVWDAFIKFHQFSKCIMPWISNFFGRFRYKLPLFFIHFSQVNPPFVSEQNQVPGPGGLGSHQWSHSTATLQPFFAALGGWKRCVKKWEKNTAILLTVFIETCTRNMFVFPVFVLALVARFLDDSNHALLDDHSIGRETGIIWVRRWGTNHRSPLFTWVFDLKGWSIPMSQMQDIARWPTSIPPKQTLFR